MVHEIASNMSVILVKSICSSESGSMCQEEGTTLESNMSRHLEITLSQIEDHNDQVKIYTFLEIPYTLYPKSISLTGAGWGQRLKLAAMFQCIPVVVADNVQVQYFFLIQDLFQRVFREK